MSAALAVAAALGRVAPLVTTDAVIDGGVRVLGLAILAGLIAGGVTLVYRWYFRSPIPDGVAILVGLAPVGVSLNTTTALGSAIAGKTDPFAPEVAGVATASFAMAAISADLSRRGAESIGGRTFAVTGAEARDVTQFVRSAGRATRVTLPADVEDIEGYDPVASETKDAIAGTTLVFPRRLTVTELRDRLAARLHEDFGVGQVDVELDADGSVSYLAVGSRPAGVGQTLAPGTVAVAVRADPANSASPGDAVQVYRAGEDGPKRVARAELRASAGDVVTLAVDERDADVLDPAGAYRLATLPVDPGADREFASQLRAADETMGVATLAADSRLVGTPVGALDVTVVAVGGDDGGITAIPQRSRVLAAGDRVYVLARPETIRRFEAAAEGATPDGGAVDGDPPAATDGGADR